MSKLHRHAIEIRMGDYEYCPNFARLDVMAATQGKAYELARVNAIHLARLLLEWAEQPTMMLRAAEGSEPVRIWPDMPEEGRSWSG